MSGDQDKSKSTREGDLESSPTATEDERANEEVPLLQDVIKTENPVHIGKKPKQQDTSSTKEEDGGLDESTIWALLGDEWKETSDDAFKQVQTAVDQNKELWRGQDTEALNKVLKVRIDKTLHAWLRETVNNNIDSLRKTLLVALTEEIDKRLAEIDSNHHEG